jgi:hypothetical protein
VSAAPQSVPQPDNRRGLRHLQVKEETMSNHTRKPNKTSRLCVAIAAVLVTASAPALADDDHWHHDHGDHRHWDHDHRHYYYGEPGVVYAAPEPVYVAPRPVYVAPAPVAVYPPSLNIVIPIH